MVAKLFPLLLKLPLLGSATAWPVSNPQSQIGFSTTEVLSPEQRLDPGTSQSLTEPPSQDIQEPVNHPVIIRVDYSNIHPYDEDATQSSWLKLITGKHYLNTPSLVYQQVWVCGEQTSSIKCHLRTTASYERPIESYLASVVVCRAIAVLIFSTSLMVSVIAMLWSSISPPRNTMIVSEDLIVEEKPYRTADTQRVATAA